MRPSVSILVLAALVWCSPAAVAQTTLLEKFAAERLGAVQPGAYIAGDKISFEIEPAGEEFFLRFDGNPETFVLYSDRASMGSRVLKYDSGETAIRVAGWGSLTLYTDAQPNGLPAVRTGEATMPRQVPVSVEELERIASGIGERLGHTRKLHITFTADWSVLETDSKLRAMALDTMQNTARGLDRFARSGTSRDALASRVSMVTLATSARPTLGIHDRTLIVTFNPERGYFGRASSRAIARALGIALRLRKP